MPVTWTVPVAGETAIEFRTAAVTVIVVEPDMAPLVAVIVVEPVAWAVTRPAELTEAIPEFADDQVTYDVISAELASE